MSAMFEFCCLRCEYAELHAPSSYGLDELLILSTVQYIHDCSLTTILIFSASAMRGAFFAAVPSKNDSAPTLTNGENLQKVYTHLISIHYELNYSTTCAVRQFYRQNIWKVCIRSIAL